MAPIIAAHGRNISDQADAVENQTTNALGLFESGGGGVFCQFQREEAQKLRSFRSLIYKPQEHP